MDAFYVSKLFIYSLRSPCFQFVVFLLTSIINLYRFTISATTHAAWKQVPTSYVVCEDDRACLTEWQMAMLANVEKQGVHIDTHHLNTSHSPFLSQPEKLVEIIRRVAGEDI